MGNRFRVRFPAPQDTEAVVSVVLDPDSVQDATPGLTQRPRGPQESDSSPSISINTRETAPRQPESLSYPDVQILPINTSTTGQPDIIYRSPTAGVIFTWSEAVTGFGVGDIGVTVRSNIAMAQATLTNFRGAPGSTSYTSTLNFPASGEGVVTITVSPNSARSVATMREGPIGIRTRSFSFEFSRGTVDGTPAVEIQLPAKTPYIGRTAPIRFLWNIPVVNFGIDDITFNPSTVTLQGSIMRPSPLLWEGTMNLPAVASPTMVTVTIRADSVESQFGVQGPERHTANSFTYDTPAAATSGAPSGTTIICDTEMPVDSLNYLSLAGITGGALYGISDLVKVGNNLFGVAQVRKRRAGRTNELGDSFEAGAAVFRVNLQTRACTIIRAYPSVLEAARSLTGHNGSLYWMEGSAYIYQYGRGEAPVNNPRIGNLGRYDISANCASTLGKLWRIELGRQFGDEFQKDYGVAGGTFSPMISAGNKLLALPGIGDVNYVNYSVNRRYLFQKRSSEPSPPEGLTFNIDTNQIENLGDWQISQPPDDQNLFGLFEDTIYLQQVEIDARSTPPRVLLVGDVEEVDTDDFTGGDAIYGLPTASTGDAASARGDNWGLLSWSNSIEPRLELLQTNEKNAWELMLEFARATMTILSFQQGLTFFKPRLPVRAVLTSALSDSASSLDFRYTNINRPFPINGTVLIRDEVIEYSGTGASTLTMLLRGQSYTTPASHSSGDGIVLIDHVLTETAFETPLDEIVIESDFVNVYNSIRVEFDDGERMHREDDETSIQQYGEKEFTVSAPFLSRHQNEWVRWIAEHTLANFKDLQHTIRLQLAPRFDLQIGQYVYLQVTRDSIRRVGIITRLGYSTNTDAVDVVLRTITI